MQGKKVKSVGILVMVVAGLLGVGLAPGDIVLPWEKRERDDEPELYITVGEGNDVGMAAADGNVLRRAVGVEGADVNLAEAGGLGLIVLTHGWFERTRWPEAAAFAIRGQVDGSKWVCGWYDWRGEAKRISPVEAAEYARDIGGPLLGGKICDLSKGWRHVHLVGHSAGSWVISEAARVIARETDASIHLTFLDAYVPVLWDANGLCGFCDEPNLVWWADHYMTRDLTLGVTQKRLACAHNVDLTEVDPGINDHELPRYWYHGTVIGEYEKGERYGGKKLYKKLGTLEYGFARGLEAGEDSWRRSRELKVGNKPVKMRLPRRKFGWPFNRLFRRERRDGDLRE
jgi:hypothetical protein